MFERELSSKFVSGFNLGRNRRAISMQLVGRISAGSTMTPAVVMILLVGLVSGSSALQDATSLIGGDKQNEHQTLSLQTLFNLEQYKELFGKQYATELEEITRKIYFMNSAFMVYVSAVAYQFRRSSSYEALNHMSDMSPQELDMMTNKVMSNLFGGSANGRQVEESAGETEQEPEVVAALADELEANIRSGLKEAHLDGALVLDDSNLRGQRRRKRDIGSEARQERAKRHLLLKNLIHVPNAGSEEESLKLERNPEGNNPHYDQLALELDTRGLNDELAEVTFHWPRRRFGEPVFVEAPEEEVGWFPSLDSIRSVLAPLSALVKMGEKNSREQLPDEMFVDHRKSGCLAPVRDQRLCGSCYAFAGIALAEFLYCNHTEQLVEFSEQYLIDCGRNRFKLMGGCDGGIPKNLPQFIHNFGLELRARYPYSGKDSHCPYHEDLPLAKTGFIRLPLERNLEIPMTKWAEQLESGPLYIVMTTPRGFSRYGGGIDSGKRCSRNKNYHAMLLVGHGREDGQEFWLIRNSYGRSWGEKGYYKLAKSVPVWCIEHQVGYTYGTRDGISFNIRPKENELNRDVELGERKSKESKQAKFKHWSGPFNMKKKSSA